MDEFDRKLLRTIGLLWRKGKIQKDGPATQLGPALDGVFFSIFGGVPKLILQLETWDQRKQNSLEDALIHLSERGYIFPKLGRFWPPLEDKVANSIAYTYQPSEGGAVWILKFNRISPDDVPERSHEVIDCDRGSGDLHSTLGTTPEMAFLKLTREGWDVVDAVDGTPQTKRSAGKGSAKKPGRPPKSKLDKTNLVVRKMIDCGDVDRYARRWKGDLLRRYADQLPKKMTPDGLRKLVEREESRRAADNK